MTDAPAATRQLAEYAATVTADDIPVEVTEAAKLVVLDTVGVAMAAVDFPIGRILTDYAAAMGGAPTARVLGTDLATSPQLAAQINGTLAHGLDYDDHGHLSTHVLPAALAVGESLGSSGADLLTAYVVGRECGYRLSSVIEAKRKQKQGPTYRGWYRVGVVGPVAAAVAASRMLGLDPERTRHAIGIASSSSAGLRRNLGTMTKALHAGNGASAGVTAAMLAARGFTADAEAIEGPLGLVNAICLPGEAEWAPLARLGAPYELSQKLGVKYFPACSPSHKPLVAMLKLRRDHAIDPARVASIEADLHEFSLRRLDPTEAIATGYSLPYLLAIALVDGRVGPDQVNGDRLHDPVVRQLMAKVVADPDAAPAGAPERVTIRLDDGTVLTAECGCKPDLSEPGEIAAKFDDCAGRRLDLHGVTQLKEAILDLGAVADVRDLTAMTTGKAGSGPC
ncbi:MmgE/PrpD family protein [Micromonospora sp. NPDC023966]|jgi:2-methylcitrate dehydratase PrpD|uniref:MmgE/PrpD family protein n=1 Tax=Micromonospora sp. NPDC023966 TaxID=3154699 RepID=UPI0034100C08